MREKIRDQIALHTERILHSIAFGSSGVCAYLLQCLRRCVFISLAFILALHMEYAISSICWPASSQTFPETRPCSPSQTFEFYKFDVPSDTFVDRDIAHRSPVHTSNLETKPSARPFASAARDARAARQTAVKNNWSDSVDSLSSLPTQPSPHVYLHTRITTLHSSEPREIDCDGDENSSACGFLSFCECLLMHPQDSLHRIHPQRLVVPLRLHLVPASGLRRASPRWTTRSCFILQIMLQAVETRRCNIWVRPTTPAMVWRFLDHRTCPNY